MRGKIVITFFFPSKLQNGGRDFRINKAVRLIRQFSPQRRRPPQRVQRRLLPQPTSTWAKGPVQIPQEYQFMMVGTVGSA